MSVTPDSFRQGFMGAFADSTRYPDETIAFWIGVAGLMLNQIAWGAPSNTADVPPTTKIDLGTNLYVAHQIILEKQSADAAARGATPGLQKGAISGDSVDKVSRNYDTSAGLELDGGHWNLTVYGTRFRALAQMVGGFPLTVGGGGWCGPNNGPAWLGPPPWPGYFG